mmetsp:Transcript_19877/g.50585  ORF Transcript_19877/g.50585 Transcript_19877/m.50585 type:complete len:271 (+) Transcript_19877:4177-4989(+)
MARGGGAPRGEESSTSSAAGTTRVEVRRMDRTSDPRRELGDAVGSPAKMDGALRIPRPLFRLATTILDVSVLVLAITSPLPTANGGSSCAGRASDLRLGTPGDVNCLPCNVLSSSSNRGASTAATSDAISAALADAEACFSERSRRFDGRSARRACELGPGLLLPGAGPALLLLLGAGDNVLLGARDSLLLGAGDPLLLGAGDALFLAGAGDTWSGAGASRSWASLVEGGAGGALAAGRGAGPDCFLLRCKCTFRTAVVSPGKITAGAPK